MKRRLYFIALALAILLLALGGWAVDAFRPKDADRRLGTRA